MKHLTLALVALLSLVAVGAGCGTAKTETGYTPRALSMNDTQRRALYAPAFTPESAGLGGEAAQDMPQSHPFGR